MRTLPPTAPAENHGVYGALTLNRVRPLSLEMIRKLTEGLKLPAEVLIRPYRLRQVDKELVTA